MIRALMAGLVAGGLVMGAGGSSTAVAAPAAGLGKSCNSAQWGSSTGGLHCVRIATNRFVWAQDGPATPAAAVVPTSAAVTPAAAASKSSLTTSQQAAARSAKSYLSFSGFSRQGLIHQLSSDAGDKFSVDDATAAVDSLNADWKAQAARSAKSYLSFSGFSCQGLIHQLSSDAGEKYTVEEATYGATQVGLC